MRCLVFLVIAQASSVQDGISESLDRLSLTAERIAHLARSPFVSLNEFKSRLNVARMIDKGTHLFVDDAGNDMIELMRETLKLSTRQEAVDYFVIHNRKELDFAITKTFNTTSDPIAAILMSQVVSVVSPVMVFPIIKLVAEFLNLIRKPCLIDNLPLYFEDSLNYEAMFTPLDRSAYRVNLKDEGLGMTAILHDKVIDESWTIKPSTWNSPVVQIERQSLTHPHHTRLVDLRAGCAVDVDPSFRDSAVISSARLMYAWEKASNKLFIWRGDEIRVLETSHRPDRVWMSQGGEQLLVIECFYNPNGRWITILISQHSPFPMTIAGPKPETILTSYGRRAWKSKWNGSTDESFELHSPGVNCHITLSFLMRQKSFLSRGATSGTFQLPRHVGSV